MSKRAINDAKAKAKKQKMIAIGGFVLLLGLLAFQGPKTLKLLHPGPPPASSAPAPAPATPVTPSTPAPTGTPVSGTPVPGVPTGAEGLVVNADLSPVPLEGQLAALTEFTSKDPFKPQASTTAPVDGSGVTTPTGTGSSGTAPKPGATGSFTPSPSGPTQPSSPGSSQPTPTIATISVNGVEMAVSVKSDFPTDSPFFRLVSLTSTTAKIGIAGGSLATGTPTVTLKKGKPVTLMNTADGTRYVLVLVAFGDTTTPVAATTATTPATTTPTTTTP
jgi:hypothetical protein